MKPLRIGILTHKYPGTKEDRIDARIHIYDFAHALIKFASVFVLAPDPGGEKETETRVPVSWFFPGNIIGLFTKGRQAAVEFVQENKIDVCLAAWAIPSGYFAYHVKKTLGIPYAVWALGSDIHTYARYPILRQLIATWLTHADFRFANSYCLCDDVMRLSGKDCTFMPVISDFPTMYGRHSGLDPESTLIQRSKMDPGPLRRSSSEASSRAGMTIKRERNGYVKPFQFLYVGRLERVKGIDMLIHACTMLKEQGEPFRLNIVGDGSLRNHLERDVKKNGLDDDILFFGNQDKAGVIKYMLNAECLVIPSRKESFPQVLLEAAKVGLPVITTDVGDCRRIFTTYRCGILVEKNNLVGFVEAMVRCIGERRHLQKLYGKGLQSFVKSFTAVRPEVILMQKLKTEVTIHRFPMEPRLSFPRKRESTIF